MAQEPEELDAPSKAAQKSMEKDGTTILVGNLYPGIASRFSVDAKEFESELRRMVGNSLCFYH